MLRPTEIDSEAGKGGRNASKWKAWFLTDGYAWDWLAAAILIIIDHVIPELAIKPIQRYYTPGDATLSYPYKKNTISSSVLYVLTFILPGTIFIIGALLQRSFADGHHALLSLAEGFALTAGWKRFMNLVGRLRPNWLSVVALGNASTIKDSRLAYPSGHAAYMFFSATILAAWLMGKFRVLSSSSQGLFVKLLVCLSPLWLATFVACSRLADFKHDFADVNAGCFIGITCGLLAYMINYHSLMGPMCDQPKLRTRLSPLSDERAPSRSEAKAGDHCCSHFVNNDDSV